MIRRRITAALVSFGIAASLLATTAAVPATTLASTPDWEPMVVTPLPDAVTPGAAAGYRISIKNDGPSNISQLYMFATDATFLVQDTTAAVYVNANQGSCNDPSTGFYCTLGQLRAGATVIVIVAYTAPQSLGSVTHYFAANTTGATTSDGGTSHGDTNDGSGTTSILAANGDFAGQFVNSTADQIIADNQTISATNQQSTKVVVNNKYIPVTARDGHGFLPSDLQNCTLSTSTFGCADLFGEWSQVNVNNGAVFSSYFTITIQIDATLIPSGLNAKKLVVYHQYQDSAGVWHQEAIIASCSGSAVPCRVVTTGKVYWSIVIRTYHNGSYRLG